MKRIKYISLLLLLACQTPEKIDDTSSEWQLGPFKKIDEKNPILRPLADTYFDCPVRKEPVDWQLKDVFNPAAINRNDTIFMLYRAEDTVGILNGTSRIGLAWSLDGLEFSRNAHPVFFPDNDEMKIFEWEGGIEDPRVVRTPNDHYLMTYTAYDGRIARLCIAVSPDLVHWEKKGLAFKDPENVDLWSKSGAIITEMIGNTQTAAKINDLFWMYWGDTDLFIATSENLIDWTPVRDGQGNLLKVMSPRPGTFDSRLVEPGPPAMITNQGIVLIYNGMNLDSGGDPNLAPGTYSGGQALFDKNDPTHIINRLQQYFITPDKE